MQDRARFRWARRRYDAKIAAITWDTRFSGGAEAGSGMARAVYFDCLFGPGHSLLAAEKSLLGAEEIAAPLAGHSRYYVASATRAQSHLDLRK
jgi:hypothetical protein